MPGHLLQQESVSAEDPGSQRLLETDPELNLGRGAEEAVTMNQILHAGTNLHRLDVPRDPGSKGNLAASTHRAVFRHEQASAARHSLQGAEDSSPSAELGVRLQLNGAAHPGELTCF